MKVRMELFTDQIALYSRKTRQHFEQWF